MCISADGMRNDAYGDSVMRIYIDIVRLIAGESGVRYMRTSETIQRTLAESRQFTTAHIVHVLP